MLFDEEKVRRVLTEIGADFRRRADAAATAVGKVVRDIVDGVDNATRPH